MPRRDSEGYQGHRQDMSHVGAELRAMPNINTLADNEVDGYLAIERAVHRHQFYDHDCQTVSCKAMFIWNSAEMTQLLADAYERGLKDGAHA